MKYVYSALVAAVSMLFVGCSDDNDPTYLDEVKVSSSYIALPAEGGSKTITVTANADWQFAKVVATTEKDEEGKDVTVYVEKPEWLTLSAMQGGAGETQLTITATAAEESREVDLAITCAGAKQTIRVFQVTEKQEVPISTCAEVIAGPDKTYRVKGVCTRIANTSYGNFYLNDGTGELYIYGTVDAGGNYNWASFNIAVGDVVTVEGPKTVYGGTVELVDATFIEVEKSLIKVDATDPEDAVLPLEGGDLTVTLTNKGNGINVEIPAEAKSWISVTGVNTSGSTSTVKFNVAANEGGDRSTTLVFTTTDGSKEYSAETSISQKGAIVECSIAEFNAAEVGATQYRLTGIITKVANTSYGNFYLRDYSGETYVYGIGAKGDFEALGLKEGDIVTIIGQRGQYGETIEALNSTVEAFKSVTEVTLDEFLAKEDNPDVYYKVSGIVDEVANPTYGNLYLKDGDTRLYVYGCYPGWGATGDYRKDCLADKGIAVGDKLTVVGVKSTYNGTPQVNGGLYFSHEKAE